MKYFIKFIKKKFVLSSAGLLLKLKKKFLIRSLGEIGSMFDLINTLFT